MLPWEGSEFPISRGIQAEGGQSWTAAVERGGGRRGEPGSVLENFQFGPDLRNLGWADVTGAPGLEPSRHAKC